MRFNEEFWIMKPFNTLFFAALGAFLLLLVIASLLLKGKSERTKSTVLITACVITMIGFVAYKYFLSLDTDYDAITTAAGKGGFNWWGELPLHLCNINMLLIPAAVLKKSRPLMCFSFFMAPLGAMMALMMPSVGFYDCSLLLPRMLGYYGTHFMIVIEGLALAAFGLFRPKLRDLPKAVITALLIAFVIFLINMLFRWTGLYPNANYFYSVDTNENFLLEMFYRWIPCPFLYLLPSVGIIAVYMLLITVPFELADRKKRKEEKNKTDVDSAPVKA